MGRSESICGVILAAGASTRMGRDKALLPWPPPELRPREMAPVQSFLSAAIRSLYPYSDLVIVVAGANETALLPIVYANAAFIVRNPDPSRGQFSSLQIGLQEVLNRGRDAALVTLVDRPPAQPGTIAAIRDVFIAAPTDVWAVVPEYAGKHGHPVLFGREMIDCFLRAPVGSSGREVEHEHQARIRYIPVHDPFVTANIDTPQEYEALRSHLASSQPGP